MALKHEDPLASRRSELTRLAEFIGVDADPEWLRTGAGLLGDGKRGGAAQLAPDELAALRESCEPGAAALRESR